MDEEEEAEENEDNEDSTENKTSKLRTRGDARLRKPKMQDIQQEKQKILMNTAKK
jgi:hypothetical protein